MSVTQISVFVESRPGHLTRALETFSGNGVNVRGFSAADTGEYGIVRFIVDKPAEALELLREAGAAVQASQVLCVELEDRPGALESALATIADKGINVVYCYSMMGTYIVLAVKDLEAAEAALGATALKLVDQRDIERI